MAPEQEIAFLREQAKMLKEQMDQIDARIKELEKATK
jgi:prefoldin subunit 5